jgi:GNAT superfamily N-acetyltransferase
MAEQGGPAYLRPCTPADDPFLAVVFSTTWADQVAALPNQNLAQHVLRIQHIAQERRFAVAYPGHERYVVVSGDEPVGRLYLQPSADVVHIVDLTLMPAHRSRGLATRIVHDLCDQAALDGRRVSVLVSRLHPRVADLVRSLGFAQTSQDDLETLFEWVPPAAGQD